MPWDGGGVENSVLANHPIDAVTGMIQFSPESMMSDQPLILEWEETFHVWWDSFRRALRRRFHFWVRKLIAIGVTIAMLSAIRQGAWFSAALLGLFALYNWCYPWTILLWMSLFSNVRREWDQPYTIRVTIDDAGVRTESPGRKVGAQRLYWRRFRSFEGGDDGYMLKFDNRPLKLPARSIPTDEVEQQLCNILTQHLPAGDPVTAHH